MKYKILLKSASISNYILSCSFKILCYITNKLQPFSDNELFWSC